MCPPYSILESLCTSRINRYSVGTANKRMGKSMREIRKICQQLQLAGELLRTKGESQQRLALVLIDNVVDVMLFHAVKRCLKHLNSSWMYAENRPGKKRQRELLRSFPQRCTFLEAPPHGSFTRHMRAEDSNLLKAMHLLRNETYHEGVIRDRIFESVVHAYAASVPAILSNLWSGWYSCSTEEDVQQILSDYGLDTSSRVDITVFRTLCSTALGEVDHKSDYLRYVLVEDLRQRVNSAKEMFDYASAESRFNGDDNFKWSEFWEWVNTQEKFDLMDGTTDERYKLYYDIYYKEYIPQMRLASLDIVLDKAGLIEHSTTDSDSLTNYWKADEILKPMEEYIYGLVAAYEEHIEGLIDDMKSGGA